MLHKKHSSLIKFMVEEFSFRKVLHFPIGSFDAWKLPVIIMCALIGAALIMLFAFYLYIKYTQNRSILRNTFIVGLNVIEPVAKSTGSLPTMSMASSNNSKTQTHSTMEWGAGTEVGVVKVVGGEQFLTRTLCGHLQPEALQWSAKVCMCIWFWQLF